MSKKTVLALMIVFMVLGSFAFFDPFDLKAKRESRNEQSIHLFWLKEKRAESFILRRADATFEFQCASAEGCPFDGSGDWKLTQPVKDLADPSALGTVLSTLRALNIQEEIKLDSAPDPAEFGFDETKLRVEFRVKGEGQPYVLSLGKPVPVGANVYALSNRAPNTVYLVANTVPVLLKHDLFHWRNKRLFPGTKPDMITRISWTSRGQTFSAERADKGWNLTSPVKGPANSIMIDGLVSTLSYTNAKAIYAPAHSDPSAQKVLKTKPLLTASFGPSEQTQFKLNVFAQAGAAPNATDFVAEATGLDPLFVVEGNPLERFQKQPSEYRDRRLFPGVETEGATRLTFHFARLKKTLTLERKGDAWVPTAGDPPSEPLSQNRVNAFSAALGTAEAKDFATDPSFAKLTPDVEIAVGEGAKDLASARFVVTKDPFAKTAGVNENEVRRFGADFLKLLPIRPQDLYESSNKQVVTQTPEAPHGHDHDHGHAH